MARHAGWRQLVRPIAAVVFAAGGQAIGGVAVLGVAYANADALRQGGIGIALLLLTVGVIGCGFALLPTHVLSLLAGWAFGLPVGLLVALGGATAASPVGYVLGRWLAGPGLIEVAQRNPRGAAVCDAITRAAPARAFVLVGLLRLSPVVPYGSTNVLAAASGVPIRPFVLGTLIGLAPRVAAVVALGAGLERLDFSRPASPWLVVLGVGATVLALVLMGWFAKRALAKAVSDTAAAETVRVPV